MPRWQQYPREFKPILLCEFWNRMACYGLLTYLFLHLSQFFHLQESDSFVLYGTYAALSFAAPFVGGVIADRFLGILRTVLVGDLFLLLGCLMMASSQLNYFFVGLSFLIMGIGFTRGNIQSLLGNSFDQQHKQQRENGFTVFYAVMNLGSMLGPLIFGFAIYWAKPQQVFLISALAIAIGLFFLLRNWQMLKQHGAGVRLSWSVCISLLVVCLLATGGMFWFFEYPEGFSFFGVGCLSLMIIYLIRQTMKLGASERGRLFLVYVLTIFSIFFFIASLQVGGSITGYINDDIVTQIGTHLFGANLFSAIVPFAVVISAPLLVFLWNFMAKHYRQPLVNEKIAFAMFIVCLAYLALYGSTLGINSSVNSFSMICIIVGIFLLGTAEICFAPVILNAICDLAPEHMRGTMMGVWYLAVACAGWLSGFIAKVSSTIQLAGYIHEFQSMALFSFAVCLLSLMFLSKVGRRV